MAVVEAPISRYKKNNLVLWIVLLVGLSAWFAYDGYVSEKFITKHTLENGQPDLSLQLNRKAPFFMVGGAILLGIWYLVIKGKKAIADETALRIGKLEIPYTSIESIDKTYFDTKGFFLLKYKNNQQQASDLKLSDRAYDNLPAVLDLLISKIS